MVDSMNDYQNILREIRLKDICAIIPLFHKIMEIQTIQIQSDPCLLGLMGWGGNIWLS